MDAPATIDTSASLFRFDNSYARLPERFYQALSPTAVAAPALIRLNDPLALALGLDPERLRSAQGVSALAGNVVPAGAASIALAYAGHQFAHFVPQLGDGRALLLGEVIGRDGGRRDIQLKGSGPTRFSRHADGRAALGPVLREYVVSEAFAALGIPTTRALAAVATGEHVYREGAIPGAVLARVASSHIRVGTFQYFAVRQDWEGVRLLADHVIARHYPDAAAAAHPYRALLDAVSSRQADLIARWLLVGFVHGVMNTDNMSIAGETIDFGPCAFLDEFDPGKVFSSIDRNGRYAYANQPRIALWNLTRFAETLLPLLADEADEAAKVAQGILEGFSPRFRTAYSAGLLAKIGIVREQPGDVAMAQDLLQLMADNAADLTLTFRRLCDAAADSGRNTEVAALFAKPEDFLQWSARWRSRLAGDGDDPAEIGKRMRDVNPAIIPRNHLIEEAIEAALRDDFGPFHALVDATASPFVDRPPEDPLTLPPRPEQVVHQTFCGT